MVEALMLKIGRWLRIMFSGSSDMVLVSTSGAIYPMNRKAYEAASKGYKPDYPQYEDIKIGRPRARDGSRCIIY